MSDTTNLLATEDASVSSITSTVTEQISSMQQCANQIIEITNGVAANFQSQAATQFASAMSDWQDMYQQIITKYNDFLETFQSGHGKIASAHEDATTLATGLSSRVFEGLNGR